MAKRKSISNSSDREKKWDKVFNALAKLSQNLNKDRQYLEEKIKSLNEIIYQMKMEQKMESAKVELVLGLKEKDAIIYKNRYENVEDELGDFREWFNYLSEKISEANDGVSNKGESPKNRALQDEVKKLKSELEKCKSEKKTENSALLDEKKFVWNQYKKMDSNYTERLKKKCDEVEHANEKVKVLVNRAEELQFSNERLKTNLAMLESDSVQKSKEIFKLLKEIELLKSRSGSTTPLLRRCTAGAGPSHRDRTITGSGVTVKKESDPSNSAKMALTKPSAHKSTGGKAPKKQLGSRRSGSSKRKAVDVITIPDDTPKLFTSSFKVPKLKSSSSSSPK